MKRTARNLLPPVLQPPAPPPVPSREPPTFQEFLESARRHEDIQRRLYRRPREALM